MSSATSPLLPPAGRMLPPAGRLARLRGAGNLADQHAQAEPHRQQVEQRLEDTGREHQPGVPVDPGVPFDQPQAARVAARPLEPGEQAGRRQHPQRDARHAVSPQT